MHIAAANPLALTRRRARRRRWSSASARIAEEKAAESGKPPNIVEKMVEGAMAKFRKENALLSQLFVMDNKTQVEDVVAAAAQGAGAPIDAEGLSSASSSARASRRRTSDFAAEVAAAAGTRKAEPVA